MRIMSMNQHQAGRLSTPPLQIMQLDILHADIAVFRGLINCFPKPIRGICHLDLLGAGRLQCRVALQMKVGIAVERFYGRESFKVMPNIQLIGHPHPTMKLHGLLAHHRAALAHLHFQS